MHVAHQTPTSLLNDCFSVTSEKCRVGHLLMIYYIYFKKLISAYHCWTKKRKSLIAKEKDEEFTQFLLMSFTQCKKQRQDIATTAYCYIRSSTLLTTLFYLEDARRMNCILSISIISRNYIQL